MMESYEKFLKRPSIGRIYVSEQVDWKTMLEMAPRFKNDVDIFIANVVPPKNWLDGLKDRAKKESIILLLGEEVSRDEIPAEVDSAGVVVLERAKSVNLDSLEKALIQAAEDEVERGDLAKAARQILEGRYKKKEPGAFPKEPKNRFGSRKPPPGREPDEFIGF